MIRAFLHVLRIRGRFKPGQYPEETIIARDFRSGRQELYPFGTEMETRFNRSCLKKLC